MKLKYLKFVFGAIFMIALIAFNLQSFDSKSVDTYLGAIISTAHADGESGGGTYQCYYNYTSFWPMEQVLICTSQYTCSYRYVWYGSFSDECYEIQ